MPTTAELVPLGRDFFKRAVTLAQRYKKPGQTLVYTIPDERHAARR